MAAQPGRKAAESLCSDRCASSAPAPTHFHAELAEPIAEARVEYAILVGEEMGALAKALGQKVNFEHVPDVASAIGLAREEIGPGDAVLVKGSNSIGLAKLVEALASGKS